MGQVYTLVAQTNSVAAAAGLGEKVLTIKTPSTANVRIREIELAGEAGAASQPQSQTFRIRVTRGATTSVGATDGGTRTLPIPVHPQGRASAVTAVVNGTSVAAATEGGVCLLTSTYVGAAGPWKWDAGRDPDMAFYCKPSSNISLILHATDTTVVQATMTFEENVHEWKA